MSKNNFNSTEEAQKWLEEQAAAFKKDTGKEAGNPLRDRGFVRWIRTQDDAVEISNRLVEASKIAGKDGKIGTDDDVAPAAPKGADGRHTQDVDTTGAEQPEKKSMFSKAGDFLGKNKFGIAGALMVGLLATAMGGGGLMGVILGLLAFAAISALTGGSLFGGDKKEGPAPTAGKTRERTPATPGHEQAIDVEEGTDVAVVKMDGTKKTYLSGQKDNGELEYSDTPQEIELRTLNKDGKVTGIVEGQVRGDHFNITSTSAVMPDGRMGPEGISYGNITIDRDGEIDMGAGAVVAARKRGQDAATKYTQPQELEVSTNTTTGVASAVIGKGEVTVGDVPVEADIVAVGTVSKDGKIVTFDRAVMTTALGEGQALIGAHDGEVIDVELPSALTQKLAVEEGKVSPMSGDVKKAVESARVEIPKEFKNQSDKKEAADKAEGQALDNALEGKNQDQSRLIAQEAYQAELEKAGMASDPRENRYKSAQLAAEVTKMYEAEDFRAKDPDAAAAEIAAKVPEGVDREKIAEFAERNHERFSNALGDKKTPEAEKGEEKGAGEGAGTKPLDEKARAAADEAAGAAKLAMGGTGADVAGDAIGRLAAGTVGGGSPETRPEIPAPTPGGSASR